MRSRAAYTLCVAFVQPWGKGPSLEKLTILAIDLVSLKNLKWNNLYSYFHVHVVVNVSEVRFPKYYLFLPHLSSKSASMLIASKMYYGTRSKSEKKSVALGLCFLQIFCELAIYLVRPKNPALETQHCFYFSSPQIRPKLSFFAVPLWGVLELIIYSRVHSKRPLFHNK